MSEKSKVFPSDGEVVVVGISSRKLQLRYRKRVHWKETWDFLGMKSIPEKVAGICISASIRPESFTRVKDLAKKMRIPRVEFLSSESALEKKLQEWLGLGAELAVKPPVGSKEAEPVQSVQGEGELWIETAKIRPLSGQPRTYFSVRKMNELMISIKAIGQMTPILVKRVAGDPKFEYELIDGERRLRACTLLSLPKMLAVVRPVGNDEEHLTKSFVANFARDGHTPLDTARFIQRMLSFPEYKEMGRTEAVAQISRLAGKHDLWAYDYLKLLSLPEEVQSYLEPGKGDRSMLPVSMGAFLYTINSPEIQIRVCREVVEKGLSVTQARKLAMTLVVEAGITIGKRERSPSKDYRILQTYIRKAIVGAENLLTMPERTLEDLFENRAYQERVDRINEIDRAISLLVELKNGIALKKGAKESA